jgi:hypothetical protein
MSEQGVAEGSTPNKGDEVYYRNRLLGWFAGYGNNDKVIVEPNEDEGHDSNNPIYIDKSAVTIKPNQQGVAEGDDEKIADRYSQDEWDEKMQRLKKLAGTGELKTVWDPVKRVYKNVPVNQENK